MEEFISTKEAADCLGYTVQHTRLLIREGKLYARRIGRDWLVVRESVEKYQKRSSKELSEEGVT